MKGPIVVAGVTLLAVAGCGGAASAHPAQSPAATANVRVCEHYRTQRAWVLSLATPTAADALKFTGYVSVDAAQATPGTPVARALAALSRAQRDPNGPVGSTSEQVLKACRALGVKFSP